MRFIEGSLGDPNKLLPYRAQLRQTVPLGEPATHARVMLRGFQVGHEEGKDHNWRTCRVSLEVLRTDDPTVAEVLGQVTLSDENPHEETFPTIESELVQAIIDFTVIAY